jgi:hypothetical protein
MSIPREQQVLNVPQRQRNRTYTITTRRITSGDELKQRNGEGGLARDLRLILKGYH